MYREFTTDEPRKPRLDTFQGTALHLLGRIFTEHNDEVFTEEAVTGAFGDEDGLYGYHNATDKRFPVSKLLDALAQKNYIEQVDDDRTFHFLRKPEVDEEDLEEAADDSDAVESFDNDH